MPDKTIIFQDDLRENIGDAQNMILQDDTPIDLGFKTSDELPKEDEETAEDYMPPNEEEYTSNELASKQREEFCDLTRHPGFDFFYFSYLRKLIESTKKVLLDPNLRLMEMNNKVLYSANDVNCIMLSHLENMQSRPVDYMKELQLQLNIKNSLFVQKAVERFYNESGMDSSNNQGNQ